MEQQDNPPQRLLPPLGRGVIHVLELLAQRRNLVRRRPQILCVAKSTFQGPTQALYGREPSELSLTGVPQGSNQRRERVRIRSRADVHFSRPRTPPRIDARRNCCHFVQPVPSNSIRRT